MCVVVSKECTRISFLSFTYLISSVVSYSPRCVETLLSVLLLQCKHERIIRCVHREKYMKYMYIDIHMYFESYLDDAKQVLDGKNLFGF